MAASLSWLRMAGLVLAGIVGGVALLLLLLGWVSKACHADWHEYGGCAFLGGFLLTGAIAIALLALSAA
jgi:hypothetical protein